MVAALQTRISIIVEQATSCVAALVACLATNDVEDERVTWNLLIHFNLDDVATLDAGPVGHFKLPGALGEYEPLNWLHID